MQLYKRGRVYRRSVSRERYAAIIERNYLEIQPNITLLLPLSERDKIGNRNTTNRKPNFF